MCKKYIFITFLLYFSILFYVTAQSDLASVRNSHIGQMIEAGYIDFNTKLPQAIGHATISCKYEYTTRTRIDSTLEHNEELLKKTSNKMIIEIFQTVLLANSSTSIFRDYNLFLKDSILYFSPQKLSFDSIVNLDYKYRNGIDYLFVPTIVKNASKQRLFVSDEVAPNSYHYDEPKSELKWELKEDTLTVCGYKCFKATTSYGGRLWAAWYTPEIPISDGPWKLYGLPGLILKCVDQSKIHTFEATTIQKSDYPIYLPRIPTSFTIKRNEFLNLKRKLESAEKPMSTVPMSSIKLFGFVGKYGTLNERRVLKKRESFYEPLELE